MPDSEVNDIQNETGQTEQPEVATTPQQKAVPYSRFQEVNKKLRALQQEIAAKDANAEKAVQDAKLAAMQAEIATIRRTILQRDTAAKVGLPVELADRLRGDDEAAMLQDAQALLRFIRKAGVQGAPVVLPLERLRDNDGGLAWYSQNRTAIQNAVKDGRLQ